MCFTSRFLERNDYRGKEEISIGHGQAWLFQCGMLDGVFKIFHISYGCIQYPWVCYEITKENPDHIELGVITHEEMDKAVADYEDMEHSKGPDASDKYGLMSFNLEPDGLKG